VAGLRERDAAAQREASVAATQERGSSFPAQRVLVSWLHAESAKSVSALRLKCVPQQIECICLGKWFQMGAKEEVFGTLSLVR